jgi:beta-xylosidase
VRPFPLLFTLLALSSASAQHGVIREYAALDPKPDATPLRAILDAPLTDVSMTIGHDGAWYMTGSAVANDQPAFATSAILWRSTDQQHWNQLRTINGGGKRVRSPEIHFLGGHYYLTFGLEGGGTDLLGFDSTTLATSTFRRVHISDRGEDPSLFRDDDGAFYWVMGAGEVARMKADPLDGLAAPPKLVIEPQTGDIHSTAMHGSFLTKIRGYYHLFVSERRLRHRDLGRTGLPGGTDDVFVAVSSHPDSGYKPVRYLALPYAGQTTIVHDGAGQLWATWSCTDTRGIFRFKPGVFRLEIVDASKPIWPTGFDFNKPDQPVRYRPQGFLLRPDTSHIYEKGTGFLKAIPMDPVPGQRAAFPWIRDTSITRGGDGAYYMTGTSGNLDSIHLWHSPDLKHFSYVKPVFQLDATDPTAWYNSAPGRLLWAPEIHYLNGTYFIPWCLSLRLGMGLLKSTTGKADGPYVPAYPGNHALVNPNIDASLFQDDDGTPYFVWQGKYLRKLNRDLSGFAGEQVELLTVDKEQVGYEGVFLCKIGQWYVLTAAEWNGGAPREDGTYDMMYAVSRNLLGPYSRRRVGVPHGGHSTMFQDATGGWYLAFFGNDRTAPFRASAGVAPLEIRDTGDDLLLGPR